MQASPISKPRITELAEQLDTAIQDGIDSLLTQEQKIHEAKLEANKWEKQRDNLRDEVTELQKTRSDNEASYKTEVVVKENRLTKLQDEAESLQVKVDELKATASDIDTANQARREERSDDLRRYQERLADLQKQITEAEQNLADYEQAKKDKTDKLNTQIRDAEEKLMLLNKDIERATAQHKKDIRQLEDNKKTLLDSIAKLRGEEQDLLTRVAELKENAEQHQLAAQQAMQSVQKREQEVATREDAVKLKERQLNTRLRRNI